MKTHINTSDYLTSESLLKGCQAISLPVSAGLPSASGRDGFRERAQTPKKMPSSRLRKLRDPPCGNRNETGVRNTPASFAKSNESSIELKASEVPSLPSTRGKTVPIASVIQTRLTGDRIQLPIDSLPQRSRVESRKNGSRCNLQSSLMHSLSPIGVGRKGGYYLWSSNPIQDSPNLPSTPHIHVESSKISQAEKFELRKRLSCGSTPSSCSQLPPTKLQPWNLSVRQDKSTPLRMNKDEIALQLQASIDLENRLKELERKKFLQQRSEIIAVNHIMRIAEQARFERLRCSTLSDEATPKEVQRLQNELENLITVIQKKATPSVDKCMQKIQSLLDMLEVNNSV